jgi:hypothetical protein
VAASQAAVTYRCSAWLRVAATASRHSPRACELSSVSTFSISQFGKVSSDIDASFELLTHSALKECDALTALAACGDRCFLLCNGVEFDNVLAERLHKRFAACFQTFDRRSAPG